MSYGITFGPIPSWDKVAQKGNLGSATHIWHYLRGWHCIVQGCDKEEQDEEDPQEPEFQFNKKEASLHWPRKWRKQRFRPFGPSTPATSAKVPLPDVEEKGGPGVDRGRVKVVLGGL
ncbi:hypothetical protein K438DRAFT_1764249 [Mycena galopus ATCC 62051]|nr:hypothetical protein K438DRAFT_1764249 [Mycena galopus ATCC 62051]